MTTEFTTTYWWNLIIMHVNWVAHYILHIFNYILPLKSLAIVFFTPRCPEVGCTWQAKAILCRSFGFWMYLGKMLWPKLSINLYYTLLCSRVHAYYYHKNIQHLATNVAFSQSVVQLSISQLEFLRSQTNLSTPSTGLDTHCLLDTDTRGQLNRLHFQWPECP